MQASNVSKANRQLLYTPQKQTLGFPKVEYKLLLKGRLTKENKPTTFE